MTTGCANCGEPIEQQPNGFWWHKDTHHAWCLYRYHGGGSPKTMPYPFPEDQRAVPAAS